MTNRRGFLIGIGAALAAPAIVRADSLMKIAVLRESLNEKTLLRVLDELVQYQWQKYQWQQHQMGIRVVLTTVDEGLHIDVIKPEDFYA